MLKSIQWISRKSKMFAHIKNLKINKTKFIRYNHVCILEFYYIVSDELGQEKISMTV